MAKIVAAGELFITVGIPSSRDVGGGQDLPRDWPKQLATEWPVTIADRELKLAARSAWMLEFDVKNGDRTVTLRTTESSETSAPWPTCSFRRASDLHDAVSPPEIAARFRLPSGRLRAKLTRSYQTR